VKLVTIMKLAMGYRNLSVRARANWKVFNLRWPAGS
jgi:hypothetical protein